MSVFSLKRFLVRVITNFVYISLCRLKEVKKVKKAQIKQILLNSIFQWEICIWKRYRLAFVNHISEYLKTTIVLPLKMMIGFVFLERDSTSKSLGSKGLNRSADIPLERRFKKNIDRHFHNHSNQYYPKYLQERQHREEALFEKF